MLNHINSSFKQQPQLAAIITVTKKPKVKANNLRKCACMCECVCVYMAMRLMHALQRPEM